MQTKASAGTRIKLKHRQDKQHPPHKLTPPPAVQVASDPRHPDLEQRCLCKLFMLCGHVNCQSHEACEPGRGANPQFCDPCACVRASLNTNCCRSGDSCKGELSYLVGRRGEERRPCCTSASPSVSQKAREKLPKSPRRRQTTKSSVSHSCCGETAAFQSVRRDCKMRQV